MPLFEWDTNFNNDNFEISPKVFFCHKMVQQTQSSSFRPSYVK